MRTFLALILLFSWIGVCHHDAWLALYGIAHHHPSQEVNHRGDHSHGHHHGHSHHQDQDSEDEDSIPLPDSHQTLIAVRLGNKEVLTVPCLVLLPDAVTAAFQISGLFSEPVISDRGNPPPDHGVDRPNYHIVLRDCVQSNAPPVLS